MPVAPVPDQPTQGGNSMANLTRFDPFADPFEDLVRRVFKPVRWETDTQPLQIKVDVEENDKAYTVKAEIPGVKKEDINVQIEGNQVSITAESKQEKDVKENGKVIRSERYYGSLYRSFTLGQDVDQAAASAKYADGILQLTLPKKASAATKKLTVQ
jgi:HSP20 family protein